MNPFARDVFNYFSQDGHPERKKALVLLIDNGYFASPDWSRKTSLQAWLETWEEKGTFCTEGINRARLHFGIPIPASKPREVRARIVLDIKVETDHPEMAETPSTDCELVKQVMRAVRGIEYKHYDGKSKSKVTDDVWVDYVMNPEVGYGVRTATLRK